MVKILNLFDSQEIQFQQGDVTFFLSSTITTEDRFLYLTTPDFLEKWKQILKRKILRWEGVIDEKENPVSFSWENLLKLSLIPEYKDIFLSLAHFILTNTNLHYEGSELEEFKKKFPSLPSIA